MARPLRAEFEDAIYHPCLRGNARQRIFWDRREYNTNFGFYEYRARAYSPKLGRFMSEDPKLFDASDYNLFRYCHNDPIDLTDPMGLTETSDFLAGFDSFATFGIVSAAVGHFNPGYAAGINTNSVSYKAGMVVGAAAGAFDGGTELKVAGKLLSRAFTREAMERGVASEARVLKELGEAKNTASMVGKEGRSIPDFNNKKTIGEIKDTKAVSNTRQLRIQREAAEAQGKEHQIITGKNTNVSEGASQGSTVIRRPDLGPQSPPPPRVDLPPLENR